MSNTKNKLSIFFFASVLAMMFLLLLSSCAPDRKAVAGKAIGDSCTGSDQCGENEWCVDAFCADFTSPTPTIWEISGGLNLYIPDMARGYFPIINWLVDTDGANENPAESIMTLYLPFEEFSENLDMDSSIEYQVDHVKDYSGNNNHAMVHGASFVNVADNGISGGKGEYSFDGVDDSIEIQDADSLDFAAGEPFSISLWIKPTAINPETDQSLIYKHVGGSNAAGYSIYHAAGLNRGKIGVDLKPIGEDTIRFFTDQVLTHYITDSAGFLDWYHIVLVVGYTATGFTATLYVNELLAGTYSGTSTSLGFSNDGNLFIGSLSDSSQFFEGTIDDVRIYLRALSARQVETMYSGGINVDLINHFYSKIVPEETLPGESWNAEVTLNDGTDDIQTITTPAVAINFALRSSAFNPGGNIPDIYTCKGDNINPPLTILSKPPETQSFVLIVDDLDALDDSGSPVAHWLAWGIPGTITAIPEGWDTANVGIGEGVNYALEPGYAGPCPDVGDQPHHYRWRLYATTFDSTAIPGLPLETIELDKQDIFTLLGITDDLMGSPANRNILGVAELHGNYQNRCTSDNQCDWYPETSCNVETNLCELPGENPVLPGNSCTSDTQCSRYDCINSKCTEVINQIEIVLQDDQNRTQKIIALAAILRSYFSLGY